MFSLLLLSDFEADKFLLSHLPQVVAIGRFSIEVGGFQQFLGRDPAKTEGDLLRGGNFHTLPLFNHVDKLRRFQQAFHGAGVQPGKAPAENFGVQNAAV